MSETYIYDEQGKKIDYMQFNIDKPSDTYCCKSPSRGTELEEAIDLETGKKFLKKSYRYNKVNNLVEEMEFQPDGKIVEIHKYKYDTQSREIEQIIYSGDSLVKERINTKYISKKKNAKPLDSNKSLADSVVIQKPINEVLYENYIEKRVRKYDKSGKMTQSIVNKYDEYDYFTKKGNNEKLNSDTDSPFISSGKEGSSGLDKTTYELDDKERVIAVLHYNSQNIVVDKCSYKYDEFGNTVEKIYYKLGIPLYKSEYIYSK